VKPNDGGRRWQLVVDEFKLSGIPEFVPNFTVTVFGQSFEYPPRTQSIESGGLEVSAATTPEFAIGQSMGSGNVPVPERAFTTPALDQSLESTCLPPELSAVRSPGKRKASTSLQPNSPKRLNLR